MKWKILSNSITNWKDIENKKSMKCDFIRVAGLPKILVCKNFWERGKANRWSEKIQKYWVLERFRFCFDDIQDKRKKRFEYKKVTKSLIK